MTLSCSPTPDQSGPGSDGNEGVLRIPQSITWTSTSNCLVTYQKDNRSAESYPSAKKKSVYSTAPADILI